MKKTIIAILLAAASVSAFAANPTHIIINAGEGKPRFNELPVYYPCGANPKFPCVSGWVNIRGIEVSQTKYSQNEYEGIPVVAWVKSSCTKRRINKNGAGVVSVDCYKKIPLEVNNDGMYLKDIDKYLETFDFTEDDILEAPDYPFFKAMGFR